MRIRHLGETPLTIATHLSDTTACPHSGPAPSPTYSHLLTVRFGVTALAATAVIRTDPAREMVAAVVFLPSPGLITPSKVMGLTDPGPQGAFEGLNGGIL